MSVPNFHVLTIFGTRPEAIKLAPVIDELSRASRRTEVTVCVTAQHRAMLDQVLSWFEIRPDYDLDLMGPNQDLSDFCARALVSLRDVLLKTEPDLVLVQGDTTTAMVGAIAASYRRIPVGHVEAGLRTGELFNPFPEEVNRRIIGAAATLHFAPTPRAASALVREGVPKERVLMTGNTVIDALRCTLERNGWRTGAEATGKRRLVLVTTHRRESFGSPLEAICKAVRTLAMRNPDVDVVFPVHPNPKVKETVARLLSGARVELIDPLRYEHFVALLARSYIILTDSGGIQEEAPSLGKPVLVLRNTTERPEAVECGAAKLVGTDEERICREAQSLLDDPEAYKAMAKAGSPFGDGFAAMRIANAMAAIAGQSTARVQLRPALPRGAADPGGMHRSNAAHSGPAI